MDDPGYTWPAWKFGLKRGDLSNKLHDQYNTYLAPIQSPEAFYHDVSEIAHTAHSAAEFHHLAHGRRQQRLNELNEALESASFEIIGNPRLIETPQWEHAIQLFRTNSLDSLVQYFASYLPQEHRWHPLHHDSALSGADDKLNSKHHPDVMAGTSLWDYIFVRTSIFVLHLIAPLSIVVSVILSLVPLPFQIPSLLKTWVILEALFYIFIYLPLNKYLQQPANHPIAPCRADRQRLFQQCHDNIPDAGQYLRRWFRDAPDHEIKRENVKEFFRWGFLNMEDSDSTYDDELEEYIEQLEELLGRKLESGRGDAKCLRMTLDKVEMLHRSLTWYMCIFVVDTIASAYMLYHSFSLHRTSISQFFSTFPLRPLSLVTPYRSPAKRLTYWHRPHTSKTRLPILFIHGIGVGLYPYVNFLAEINAAGSADGDVGIIAVEILSVSSRITGPTMLKEEMCEEIHRILTSHGWENCVLVSHSYGSVVAAQLLRDPKISISIGPVMFIDPVSFLLHLPDVAYNFICRRPSETKEHLLSYFGSKDIGIAHTLFRRFFWADNLLWKEDLQDRPTAVVLASRDSIIDTKSIRAYLVGSKGWAQSPKKEKGEVSGDGKLDVIWFEGYDHGQAFDYKTTRLRLVETARVLCNEAASPEMAVEVRKKHLNGVL
ncbi:ribose-phosphate pyrophosphokinase [Fusarium pseudocircinatum]|uniref:Ribose-phosphate pyrophosphokinase n=1 Tax=Fusarium pseudocircinatum TaxID=56676 RepID=A0A8H5P730_9HYPO|nr:ribose-phosphate pyrophosphokinase [Fusarium pseudocircinatum]